MDVPEQRRIMDYFARHAEELGLGQVTGVDYLGEGESYRAWLARRAGDADGVVIRVARRPPEELPRPMRAEFAALGRIPAGIGPRGLHLEESPDVLGASFMVESFVPGRVVDRTRWDRPLFEAHAARLAVLHRERFEMCGELGGAGSPTLSLAYQFDGTCAWWSDNHADIVRAPDVAELIAKVERAVGRIEPVFERLNRFALIHGDLVVPNVLVDARSRPSYVDWEWAEIGDPARDLAYIGGSVDAAPWYARMTPADLDAFVDAYVREARITDPGEIADLKARRDGWELYERLFSSLHFRLKSAADPGSRYYAEAVTALTQGLMKWLDV